MNKVVTEEKPLTSKVRIGVRFDSDSVVEAIDEAMEEVGKEINIQSYNYFGDITLSYWRDYFELKFYTHSGYKEFEESIVGEIKDLLALLDFRKDDEV